MLQDAFGENDGLMNKRYALAFDENNAITIWNRNLKTITDSNTMLSSLYGENGKASPREDVINQKLLNTQDLEAQTNIKLNISDDDAFNDDPDKLNIANCTIQKVNNSSNNKSILKKQIRSVTILTDLTTPTIPGQLSFHNDTQSISGEMQSVQTQSIDEISSSSFSESSSAS